jgi:hypothetical protein
MLEETRFNLLCQAVDDGGNRISAMFSVDVRPSGSVSDIRLHTVSLGYLRLDSFNAEYLIEGYCMHDSDFYFARQRKRSCIYLSRIQSYESLIEGLLGKSMIWT